MTCIHLSLRAFIESVDWRIVREISLHFNSLHTKSDFGMNFAIAPSCRVDLVDLTGIESAELFFWWNEILVSLGATSSDLSLNLPCYEGTP